MFAKAHYGQQLAKYRSISSTTRINQWLRQKTARFYVAKRLKHQRIIKFALSERSTRVRQ